MLIVGTVVSVDWAQTLPKASGLVLGLAWGITFANLKNEHSLTAAIRLTYLFAIGFILFGVLTVSWKTNLPIMAQVVAVLPTFPQLLPENRVLGTHPNLLAATILLALPQLLAFSWRALWLKSNWQAGITNCLSIGLVLLLIGTQSRGGWIAGLIALISVPILMYLPRLMRNIYTRRIVLVSCIGVALATCAILILNKETLLIYWQQPPTKTHFGSFQTLEYRKEIWPWAVTAINDFPFTGVGLGAFRVMVHRLYPIAIPATQDIAHAHNQFLQVALDVGLPGLIAYLALLILAVKMVWFVMQHSEEWKPIAVGILASFIGLHVFGLADALALGAKPGLLFWMWYGILIAIFRITHREVYQHQIQNDA